MIEGPRQALQLLDLHPPGSVCVVLPNHGLSGEARVQVQGERVGDRPGGGVVAGIPAPLIEEADVAYRALQLANIQACLSHQLAQR